MRVLITTSLVAASILTGAAFAGPVPVGVAGAIAHFNLDREGGDRIQSTGPVPGSVHGHGFDGIFDHFNADADGQDDIRGLGGATLFRGKRTIGADIFKRLEAESAGSE